MSYTIYYIYYTVYIKYHILDIIYQILYIHILYTYYICTWCLDVTPSAGPSSSGPPSPPSSERNRPAALSSSPLWKPPCLRASRGLVKNGGNPMGFFGKKCRVMKHTTKTRENHKKKIGGWNFAVGSWFPELPALWSKPSSRPVLLPAGQSGLCSRCQRNAQLKRQLLLSPKSGCDNWDNRLNSSWSSPLGPSAHIMSSMRLDFQEFFSIISGHWLKEGTPCWYSSWKFPAITVALLIGW